MEKKSVAFIKVNDWMQSIPILEHGTHNGYVAVPPTNKYYGKHYDEVDIEVHGGLTFSEPVRYGEYSFSSKRKINPLYVGVKNSVLEDSEFISENTEIGNDWWIFGFDTFHCNDNPTNCDKEYVINETLYLQEQLER